MRKLSLVALVAAFLAGASVADAQRATERFIPLGRSPGASGRLTVIGTIVAVATEPRRIQLREPAGVVSITLQETTSIWIDRHELGLGTVAGSLEDCQTGRTAEVKYADPESRQLAEWVKLGPRAAQP